MSKVVIQGNASGTGDFTIAAPNSNTDRTLTLPDHAGEVLVNGTTSNVGIGTSSPSAKLHVANDQGGGTGRILFDANVSSGYETSLNVTDTGFEITSTSDSRPVVFNTGNTPAERMRIDGSGTVLIGKSSSGALSTGVQFYPAGTATAITANVTSNTGPLFYLVNAGSSVPSGYRFVTFRATAGFAEVGTITTNGTSTTSYNTSSDYRLKEDWQPMSGSVDRVKALKPVNFAWKADGSRVDGFLAHEAQAVVPEAITGKKDAVTAYGNITDTEGTVVQESVVEPETLEEGRMWTKVEDKPDYQGIDQSKLVPLLTAALQEAITKIEALEVRVTALENA